MVLNVADALSAYRQSGGSAINAGANANEAPASGGSFSETLKGFANETTDALQEGEKAATAGATGKADLASIVVAISKAETMLQTVATIRDKVIAAYQDISKTAV